MIGQYWKQIKTQIKNIPHKKVLCSAFFLIVLPGVLFSALCGGMPGMMLCISFFIWIWKAVYHHEIVEDAPESRTVMLMGGLQRQFLCAAMLVSGMERFFLMGIAVIQVMMTMMQEHSIAAGKEISPIFWLAGCGVVLAASGISIKQGDLICLYPLGISFALTCMAAFSQRTKLRKEINMRFHTA